MVARLLWSPFNIPGRLLCLNGCGLKRIKRLSLHFAIECQYYIVRFFISVISGSHTMKRQSTSRIPCRSKSSSPTEVVQKLQTGKNVTAFNPAAPITPVSRHAPVHWRSFLLLSILSLSIAYHFNSFCLSPFYSVFFFTRYFIASRAKM